MADDELAQPVSTDKDDDKFLAAAVAGRSKIVVSGDKHLLDVSGYQQVEVLSPAQFIDQYGSEHDSAQDGESAAATSPPVS